MHSRKTLTRLIRDISKKDIEKYINEYRPNSTWIPYYVTNVSYDVYHLDFPMGHTCAIPAVLKNLARHHTVEVFIRNYRCNKAYTDKLCFFRALCFHRMGFLDSELINKYRKDWLKYLSARETKISTKKWTGLRLHAIPDMEDFLKTNINIYTLVEKTVVKTIYKSPAKYNDTIQLDLQGYHLSYIRNFKIYAKQFVCPCCERVFNRHSNVKRHLRVCTFRRKQCFPGRLYKPTSNVFDRLESFGITVPQSQRLYPDYIFFDSESILKPVNKMLSFTVKQINTHQPICISIVSNLEKYQKAHVIYNKNPRALVQEFLDYIRIIREDIVKKITFKMENVSGSSGVFFKKKHKMKKNQYFSKFLKLLACLNDLICI